MIPIEDPVENIELLAFARVVEAKSFSRAAAELRMPRATLGRRLARLEAQLGTRLLRRTTRSLALTDAGEIFYRHARIVLDAVAQAEASVRTGGDVLRGQLRVSLPPLPDEGLLAFVSSFAQQHPGIRMQVDFSPRLVDLLREGYDVALRASVELQPGLVARNILRDTAIAVAAPDYLAANGTPRTVKDLRTHRCLTGFARGELPQSTWPVGRGVVRVESVFSSNDVRLLRDAAVRGLGIALLPRALVEELIDTGTLVHVLPGKLGAETRIAVVYPERELLPPQVRAFIEALVQWAQTLKLPSATRSTASSARRGKRPR